MNLGELIVELCADTAQLEKSLEQAKKKAYEAAASIEKSFDKINLEINVDDDSLTDLNKHLNLKVQHLKEVNKYFNNNPIVVNVDDDQLVDLNKHLHTKVQHLKEVNKYFNSNPITVNTDVTKLDELEQRLGNLSSKTITITVESDLSKQLEKSLTDAVQSAVRDAVSEQSATSQQQSQRESASSNRPQRVDVVASPMRSIVDGLFEGVGKKLTKGLDRSIEDAVGVNMDTMTRISGNMLLRYFGVGKKAQSDPKNEQKRVETIVKDGVSAFIRSHDGKTGKGGTGRGRTARPSGDDDLGVDFDSVSRIASNSALRYFGVGKKAQSDPKNQQAKLKAIVEDAVREYSGSDIRQDNSGVISRTFSEINTAFSDSINISVESIAQRAKLATIRQVRKAASSVTQNSSPNVQNAVSGFFDAAESGKKGSIRTSIGQGLASQSKKVVEIAFDKLLPNTAPIIKDFLSKGVLNKPVTPVVKSSSDTLREAAMDLKNAAKALSDASMGLKSESAPNNKATKSFVAEVISDPWKDSAPLPKQLPAKENKVPLPPPAKKRELEPIPVDIPEQIKPLFQTIQSEIVKNIDISQGYKDATAAENKLIPLPPVSSDKTANTKKYAQTSLDEIDKALTSIKKYFADEYKRIQAKVKQATAVGTHEEIKSARAEVVTFINRSKEAVATVDKYVKMGEDAGFSKDINSELSGIHGRAKSPLENNRKNAGHLEGKLNLADKKLFDQQLKGYTALAQQHGVEIPKGLQNGIKHGAGGVSDAARVMLDDFIKVVQTKMQIQSPSWLMFEMGLMITSGLFLGMQKGNSQVAQGARQIVSTVTDIVGAVKTVADPALGAASVIPGLTSISTYGSAGLSATDTGLKILGKVGKRHAANPSETLFQSVGGSAKDFVNSIVADKTLTTPRAAFDHTINIAKAGALGLGANPMAVSAVDAAQAGMTALLRNSAITKAITQAHGQTKAKLQADTSLDYMSTFKSVLNDNLKDLKLSKSEIVRAISSVMKVVPTGLGTGANSNFATAGYGVDAVVDTLSVPLDLYRKSKSKVGQGLPVKDAIASSVADYGAPQGIANVVGSLGAKLHSPLNNFIKIGKQTNEGLSQGILSTVALSSKAINTTGDTIQNQIKQNMGISSPSKVMIALGMMIASGLAIGIKQGAVDVSGASQLLTDAVDKIEYTIDKTLATKSSAVGESFKEIGESDKSSNPLVGLLSAIKKDFGSDTVLGNLVNSAKSAFSKGGSLKDIGINLITSFGQGFLSANGGVLGIVTKFATGILSKIKKVFRIASPSGEGIDVGENIAGSTGTGIDNNAHVAVDAAKNMAKDVNAVLNKTLILTPRQFTGNNDSLILPNINNSRTRELTLPTNYERPQSQKIGLDTLPLDRLFRPLTQELVRLNVQLPSTAVLRSNLPATNINRFTRPVFPDNIREVLAAPRRSYTGPLILPNSARPDLQNLNILPATQSNPYTGSILTPNPLSRYRPIITAPNQPIANPNANLILPNQSSSTGQRLILPRSVTRPPIRINLDALMTGNMSRLFDRYSQIPDPWSTAPGSGVINFPAPPLPPVPPTPPKIPAPPADTFIPIRPPQTTVPPTMMSQYLSLGKDLITNLFTAVGDSVRQSTLSGYASLGQVMRNAVNAALFSLADTLKQPLYQGLLSQSRSIMPWFMKFIPKTLQLVPMLKPLIPVLGGLTLGLGNAIIKNLLNNDVLKPGGFLTKLLSSVTRIDLSSLSGQKTHGIIGGISRMLNPIPSMFPLPPVAGVGMGGSMLGMFGMFMNTFGGILGLDQSTRSNPRNQAPTVEKVLQEQTAANRKKAGLGNAKGTQASQQLIENLGNTAIDSVLENLNIPMIPTSVIQGLTGNKLKQQSGSIAGVLNSLGVEKSRAEQLLERTVKSGRTDVGRRTDILTKQVLRERGFTQQQRDSMTPKELTAARENILKSPLDLTKRERRLLQFMGDFETHINNMGSDAAFRKGNAMVMSVLKERGLSYAERQAVKQSQGGLGQVAGSLRSNPRTGSFVGRLTEAYAGNDQEAMKGLLLEGLKKAGMSSQQLKNIDPKLLDTATAGLMASLTGLQAKFKEKGFDMGKSIAQGFKDSVRNLANAKDDLEYNAKKALGQANFGDAVSVIFKRMSRGTVATQDQFKEMYNQMGSGVKKAIFSNSKEADATFPNVLQFFGSLAATLAPVTSLFASLSPLFLPLAPIIGGIGAAVNMVAPHVAKLMDGIQRVEVLQRRFTFLGGSKAGGEAEFKYAKDIANKMNVPSETAANAYSQLAIAAKDSKMEGQGVKDLFEGITASLSALGISGQDASLVFMAYTQILAKGKLSMEELRQQLGEKFPPAMGVFAKAMGMSVPEMTALISSGGVLSHDILPKVAKVLNQDYGRSAANQAGGLVVALNKLGNVGFEITTIFTDKLGGTLGFFVSTFADGLSLFSKSLGALIPLGQSFAIGFAATIGIGLTVIMTKFKPLVTLLGSLQNLLMATFSVIATNMMPMIIGVTADVADNWLGAEKDMIANMKDGITNMVVATFSTIDSVMRSMSDGNASFSSMFGSLVQGAEQAGNMIDWLKGVFTGFFKVIPPGFIELLAMVFMFEQGAGLMTMALAPAFKGFFGALTGMLGGVAKAFVGVMTSMKVASELMMTSMSAAITASEARIKIFSATLGFLRTALTHIGVAFAILMFSKGDFSNPMGESLKEATKELNNGLTEIRANVQKTADSFDKATNNVKKLGGSLADTLPSKGVQLDIRSFWGGGDFKWDDAIKARNKGEASLGMDVLGVGALGIGGMGAGFAVIKSLSAFVAGLFASVNAMMLPLGSAIPGIIATFATVLANPLTAIVAVLAGFLAAITLATAALDLFAPKLTKKQKEFLDKPENKGIKSYFDTEDPNARLTNAQQQVLQYFEDQEKNIQNLKEFASSQGFTGKPSDFVADIKPLTIDQQQRFNSDKEISNLNRQIEDNNNRRLAVLADAKARGASPQEIKDIQNSANFKNLENQSKEMRNAVALAAADFQIGDSPEVRKTLGDIDGQIAKKQAQLKKLQEESEKVKNINLLALGGEPGASFASLPAYSNEISNVEKELKVLEAQKGNQANLIKASIQRAFDFKEIKNIDKQLDAATKRSVELNKALPSDKVRKEQGAVKQLIQQLYKKREDLVNSFGSPLPMLERMLKQEEEYKQKLISGAVEGVKGQMIPAAVQKTQARIDQLKTMIAGAKPFDVRPMEEALYTQATNAVKDANTRFERATLANRVESNLSQAKIYASSGTAQQIAPELARRQLEDLGSQRSLLTEKINSDQVALDKISQVIAAGGTNLNEAQAEFDKLKADIAKDKESLSQNTLETIKAQRDMRQALIDQTKQVAEYYRTSVREAQAAGIEFEKASNTLKNQQNASKLKQAILGTGNNIFSNFVDGLIGILQQVTDIQNTELDKTKQKIDYQNNLDDINLRVSELQRSLPGQVIPFDANKIKDFDDQLKTVQGSVVGINSNVQSVVQSLGQDAVIATNTLNDAFLGLGDTITGVGARLDGAIDKLNQANTQTDSAFDGLTVQTNQSSTDWASSALNALNQLDNATPSVLAAIPSVAVPTPSRATTPSLTVTPTVATQFASPIKNTTIQDLINYKPTFGQSVMGNRPKGRIHNKVDFDSRVKGGAGAEIVASLAGVAKLQKWGGQDAAVFVNSILPSGTQITIEYGHLALNSIKNTLGDLSKPVQVQAGQKLGNILGHHLDFGVKANGRYINPQVFLANLAKGDYGAIASQPPATAKTKANTVTPASQSKGESVIRMQRLGQKDEFGLEKIQLAVIKQGKIIDRFIVNSGKVNTQIFGGAGETKAGSKQPVEFGSYKLGKTTPSGNKAKMGNEFIRLEPDFKTERTAIGFHIDKDRLIDPGSSGCIVFANEAEFNKFKQALKSTGIKSFVFDQAVGAVEIANNVASQVKPLPQKSRNRAFDASNIVSKNKLQSLVVQELSTGQLLGSINSNVSPVSSASTVKLIVADLITDAINQGNATLQETLTIKPGEVAQWSAINKAGQKRRISELLTQMIVKSDNTAANVLINRLGGLDKLNQLAAAKGYANTKFNKYFLLPGEDTKKGNVSTAGDVTSAARELLVTNSPSDKLAADALKTTRNFKYQGEVGGKIGNNSKIIGNVGVVNINGKLYLVTAFANTNGNELTNRKFITNATNDVVKQIQGIQSSIPRAVTQQVKPLPQKQAVMSGNLRITQGGNDLSPEEYAKLTPLGKELYELRRNKYILALSSAVANAEGSDFRSNTKNFGYGLTIGGENVTDFSKHPYVGTGRKPTWIKAINNASTASGRYQMMDFNASIQAAQKQFGKNTMPDMFKLVDYQGQDQPSFSPGMQDLYFIHSLKSRGVLDQVLAGKVDPSVLNKLAQHYASIQSGKNRSAYKGQGTPQGRHSNFLKTYEENLKVLNSAQMSGSAIDPNALQTSITEAGSVAALSALLRNRTQGFTTEAQQLQKKQNVESSVTKLFLETEKGSRSTKTSIEESQLNTQGFILDNRFGVPPAQRIPLELGRFRLDITKRINELQDIISETGGVTLESLKIKLAPMFEEAAKLGIEIDPQKVEALYQETFKINQLRHEQAKKQLKELTSVRDSLMQDKETFLNNQEEVRKTGIGLQTEKLQVGLLQKQIEQRKLLQQLNPLDPRSARTADLEANLALKNADVDYREKLNSILSEEGKSLSVEEAQKRRNLAKEEFETTKQNIELKRRSDNITEDSAMPSKLLERAQFIQDSFKSVLESRSSLLKSYGLDFSAEKIDKQVAIANQQMDFAKATLQLDDFIRKNAEATEANKLTNEQIDALRNNLKLTNEAKLDAIKQQFSELGTVVKAVTSGFRSGFKEFLLSTKGFGESIGDLFNSVFKSFVDSLADIASKRMTDALFGWTAGLLGGTDAPKDGMTLPSLPIDTGGMDAAAISLQQAAQMLMNAALSLNAQAATNTAIDAGSGLFGGIFDVLSGSVFNANSTGFNPTPGLFDAIPTDFGVATLPIFASGGIVGALNKERSLTGRTPHLIVASEGERVLNHKETAIWNKLQGSVAGFATGGVVGAGGNGSIASRIGNTTTINVPVSVAVGNDSDVDTGRLSQAVQAMVSDGIRREMRVGGSINRGNPYGR